MFIFVFGVDMPLPELMFIFTMLLVLGLLVTLIEVRKLRKLILTEKADIYRFEEDLNELNPKEIEKHSKTLDGFVKTSLDKGLTQIDIEHILTKKGWPKAMVDESFYRLKKK